MNIFLKEDFKLIVYEKANSNNYINKIGFWKPKKTKEIESLESAINNSELYLKHLKNYRNDIIRENVIDESYGFKPCSNLFKQQLIKNEQDIEKQQTFLNQLKNELLELKKVI